MNPITHRITVAIRVNDLPAYQRERYSAIQEGEFFSKTRRTISALTIHQHFPGEILYRIKSIIFAQ